MVVYNILCTTNPGIYFRVHPSVISLFVKYVCVFIYMCVLTHTTLSLCMWSIASVTVAHESILRVHTLSMAAYIPVQLAVIHCCDTQTQRKNP